MIKRRLNELLQRLLSLAWNKELCKYQAIIKMVKY